MRASTIISHVARDEMMPHTPEKLVGRLASGTPQRQAVDVTGMGQRLMPFLHFRLLHSTPLRFGAASSDINITLHCALASATTARPARPLYSSHSRLARDAARRAIRF